MRQERVLLALVEAVNLVDKKERRTLLASRLLDHLCNVVDPRENRRELDEFTVVRSANQLRERCFSRTRGSPQDRRRYTAGAGAHLTHECCVELFDSGKFVENRGP